MKHIKIRLPLILLLILLSLFVLHFTQYKFQWIKQKPLDGYYVDNEKPKFSWKNWFSGSYQENENHYLKDHIGFRSFFIRLNHQLRFNLFNKVNVQRVVIGKENYLYEEQYIRAWYGDDFFGEENIERRIYKLKYLQNTLEQMGKLIIIVLAPGKGAFYPEFIPDKFHKERGKTNIEIYRKYIEELNINVIDFHSYFIENKEKSAYPLFPQFGIHWSNYGTCLVADSIIRYIEKMNHIEMPHIYWEKILIKKPGKEDNDISKALNLWALPPTFKMAYPEVKFEADSGKIKPSLLVIADSFYWPLYNMGWGDLFTDAHFWYYNEDVYPDNFRDPLTTKDLNLYDEILKNDIIIILSTDSNLPNLSWGFIDDTYDLLFK